MERLKKSLAVEFEIKDLGALWYFLGREVAHSRKGIVVSQRKYILDLLEKAGMRDDKRRIPPSSNFSPLSNFTVRRACYGVLRFVMESGGKGCEVILSGKLRTQRAKSMKFKDGYMISSGQPAKELH
ncbi:hypothetical protein ZIOFF_003564 [Zingiber officinale]|uniref:Small ribosomal subunit protein uS3 C-terminal domain-containing protein n=1 Tax=Zingiber officinale TaxID=94328 RepID=A0A8J5MAB2_ZINOF|nr:hypothetical protein ZIOFF_003564 [Zingiber officinale]